ncbi:Rha family transcriptional regulator [Vagococcus fluvialis]|uniref:Rha family transcriptional regulator n=1 Tax=Vagococcus fluvialis TaxID=2738 RepID=UPI001A8D6ECB|nr:Rha family transcriptional regulator [Vagococcus fluvialis]MBO0486074.1 Rha family transcriptional regulator [Vagococcus fluvialis]
MNLVEIKNGQPTTSSLKVAEVFEIEHKHVLRDIRDLKEDVVKNLESPNLDSVDLSMFQEDFYEVSNNNRKYPMFNMNKDGFVLLVMGYTTKRATQFKLQYIAQFNKMEKFIKQQTQPSLPQDYATALEQLAKQVRLNESLQIKVDQLSQPTLVEQTELLPNVLYSTEEIAQEIGYSSARALNQRMYAERVVYYSKKDRSWLLYAPYKDRGLKDLSTRRKSQLWTEKGREFIKVRFTENK